MAAAALLIALAGCEPVEDQPRGRAEGDGTLERLTDEMGRTVDQARDVAQEQGNRFIEEAEQRLRQMRESLASARKREDLTEDARERFNAAAEQLEDDISRLDQELRRLREEGAERWQEIGPRIRSAMDDLATSFERFRERHLRDQPPPPLEQPATEPEAPEPRDPPR